jgi:hypothetical protein
MPLNNSVSHAKAIDIFAYANNHLTLLFNIAINYYCKYLIINFKTIKNDHKKLQFYNR